MVYTEKEFIEAIKNNIKIFNQYSPLVVNKDNYLIFVYDDEVSTDFDETKELTSIYLKFDDKFVDEIKVMYDREHLIAEEQAKAATLRNKIAEIKNTLGIK